jgi:hypothetical protein
MAREMNWQSSALEPPCPVFATMKRPGSPADETISKRTRVSQSTSSHEPALSAPTSDSSSHAKAKHFDSVNVNRLRESSRPWEILSDNLPGAEVFYLPNFLSEATANKMYAELEDLDTCKWTCISFQRKDHSYLEPIPGYRPTLKVYGKSITQSRAIAAYATTPGRVVKYSGQTVDMHHPYSPLLAKLQCEVEQVLGLEIPASSKIGRDDDDSKATTTRGFNHVMLNRYDDGTVYIGRHRDTKENNVRDGENMCHYWLFPYDALYCRLSQVSA